MRFTDLREEAYNLMKARGSAVDAGIMLGRWMETSPILRDVHYIEMLTPIGPWKKGEDCPSLHLLIAPSQRCQCLFATIPILYMRIIRRISLSRYPVLR